MLIIWFFRCVERNKSWYAHHRGCYTSYWTCLSKDERVISVYITFTPLFIPFNDSSLVSHSPILQSYTVWTDETVWITTRIKTAILFCSMETYATIYYHMQSSTTVTHHHQYPLKATKTVTGRFTDEKGRTSRYTESKYWVCLKIGCRPLGKWWKVYKVLVKLIKINMIFIGGWASFYIYFWSPPFFISFFFPFSYFCYYYECE